MALCLTERIVLRRSAEERKAKERAARAEKREHETRDFMNEIPKEQELRLSRVPDDVKAKIK